MTGQFPRLRSHTRRRKSGKVVTYYTYDRRPEGEPDVPLGREYTQALTKWREIHERAPRIAGTLDEAFDTWERDRLPLYTNRNTGADFKKHLRHLRPVFGWCSWADVELPALRGYLDKRTGKTQGNREISLLSIIWNWARVVGLTRLPFPAAGMERSRWKNPEQARHFEVTDELFAAVYPHGDQVLRDCMDLASATALRLTDCIKILAPRGDSLRIDASKTGKAADFEVSLSAVLPGLLERRRACGALHLMLLTTYGKRPRPISLKMLDGRWNKARHAAALQAEADGSAELAAQIRAMFLRDMRKFAADSAPSLDAAAELLQHTDKRLTARHYRTRVAKLTPAR